MPFNSGTMTAFPSQKVDGLSIQKAAALFAGSLKALKDQCQIARTSLKVQDLINANRAAINLATNITNLANNNFPVEVLGPHLSDYYPGVDFTDHLTAYTELKDTDLPALIAALTHEYSGVQETTNGMMVWDELSDTTAEAAALDAILAYFV